VPRRAGQQAGLGRPVGPAGGFPRRLHQRAHPLPPGRRNEEETGSCLWGLTPPAASGPSRAGPATRPPAAERRPGPARAARRVWADYYRVNVFVGADAASAKVAHSYFVAADGDGKVIESTPAITRLY